MVNIEIADDKLVLNVEGWDKLWSFKSRIEVALEHIRSVQRDPSVDILRDGWPLKMGGTDLPGVITAGTYLKHDKWLFWDVHDAENAIVIELHDERYSEIVVEVTDPDHAVAIISQAIVGAAPT